MKVILVHHQDANDIRSFSGTSYFLSKAIKETFEEVVEFSSFENYQTFVKAGQYGIGKILQPIGRKLCDFLHSNQLQADYVICQGGNSCIPYYDYPIPIVFWHDSTWHTFLRGYADREGFTRFKTSFRNFYLWDRAALRRTDLLIYSSQFVADAVIRNYKVPRKKVAVIPFGANIFRSPDASFLAEALQRRLSSRTINFSFVGKDWERKGLLKAFELTERLNARGIQAVLHIIGCNPDVPALIGSPNVRRHGFLDKAKEDDTLHMENIFKETHFLVHPALAESYGISLCEANAFGIPVIGTEVEGLETIVVQGVNGFLFPGEEWVMQATELVGRLAGEMTSEYPPLFYASLKEYDKRLNWRVSTGLLKRILEQYKNPA